MQGSMVFLVNCLVRFIRVIRTLFISFLTRFILMTTITRVFMGVIFRMCLLPRFPINLQDKCNGIPRLVQEGNLLRTIRFSDVMGIITTFAKVLRFSGPTSGSQYANKELPMLFYRFSFSDSIPTWVFMLLKLNGSYHYSGSYRSR